MDIGAIANIMCAGCNLSCAPATLEEIRGLLTLVDNDTRSCAEIEEIALTHLKDVQNKIAHLVRIETALSNTLAHCSGTDVPECAVLDALLD